MEIGKDEKLLEWLDTIEASESTRKNYTFYMKLFCECVEKTPTELINESISEVKEGKLPAERKVKGYVAKFKNCLKEKDYAPKTNAAIMASLKSFYKNYDMPLSQSITRTKKAHVLEENNNFLKKDDVKNLIINTKNLRERAIVLCMATSGMAIREIINLRIKNVSIDNEGIGTIRIRRQKSQTDYVTFISPEASQALKNYLDERNRIQEIKVKGEDDSVFVSYGRRSTGTQLHPISLCHLFNVMGGQLGYGNGDGFVKSRSHALRKFFASTLENAGFPKNKVDYMIGHTVSETDKAYFERDIDKLKELYKVYLPHLAFEKTIEVRSLDTKDQQRLAELENDNKQMQSTIKELSSRNHELEIGIDRLYKYQDESIAKNAQVGEMDSTIGNYNQEINELKKQMKTQEELIQKLILRLPKDVTSLDKVIG